jgi:adenylosuccinate synthase
VSVLTSVTVSSEVLTISLTGVAVVVSLWYIQRWDRLEEEEVKKGTTEQGKGKAQSDKAGSKQCVGQTDLESQ